MNRKGGKKKKGKVYVYINRQWKKHFGFNFTLSFACNELYRRWGRFPLCGFINEEASPLRHLEYISNKISLNCPDLFVVSGRDYLTRLLHQRKHQPVKESKTNLENIGGKKFTKATTYSKPIYELKMKEKNYKVFISFLVCWEDEDLLMK